VIPLPSQRVGVKIVPGYTVPTPVFIKSGIYELARAPVLIKLEILVLRVDKILCGIDEVYDDTIEELNI
jgi:hypothetical protein